ncbi:hypothetical protein LCGC14_1926660, partial [marine sediment metagenome]
MADTSDFPKAPKAPKAAERGPMTLREMIDARPEKFYAGQTWFDGEAFMDTEVGRTISE